MPKNSSAKKQKRVFRSEEEIQGILSEVSAAQATGSKLMAALKKLNIPYNNYSKWAKKFGKSAEAPTPVAAKAKVETVAKKAKPGRVRYRFLQTRRIGYGRHGGERQRQERSTEEGQAYANGEAKAEEREEEDVMGLAAVHLMSKPAAH